MDASSRADLVAGRENGRGGAVGKMGQSGDGRSAFGTHSLDMISADSVNCAFQIELSNKSIMV